MIKLYLLNLHFSFIFPLVFLSNPILITDSIVLTISNISSEILNSLMSFASLFFICSANLLIF